MPNGDEIKGGGCVWVNGDCSVEVGDCVDVDDSDDGERLGLLETGVGEGELIVGGSLEGVELSVPELGLAVDDEEC